MILAYIRSNCVGHVVFLDMTLSGISVGPELAVEFRTIPSIGHIIRSYSCHGGANYDEDEAGDVGNEAGNQSTGSLVGSCCRDGTGLRQTGAQYS